MTDPITSQGRLTQIEATKASNAKSERRISAVTPDDRASSTQATPSVSTDRVDLSAYAKTLDAEPAFDRNKVESIRRAIQEGQYAVDPRRIAESFMAIERMIGQ